MPTIVSAGWSAALLVMAMSTGSAQSGAPEVGLDHVILGIDSLNEGINEFSRLTGVAPKRGGQHPGRGTENALVSLGEGRYLEILAPVSGRPADAAHARPKLTPTGWALHARDLPALVARLRGSGFTVSGPSPGSRRQPDGTLLEWQTAAVTGSGLEIAPFFIQWSKATAHPSTTSPTGCRLVDLEVTDPQPARLAEFFRVSGFAVTVRTGSAPRLALTLECPHGRVRFR